MLKQLRCRTGPIQAAQSTNPSTLDCSAPVRRKHARGTCNLVDGPRARLNGMLSASWAGRRTCDLFDHPKTRADRTVHSAGARPFVRVLTRKEHPIAKRPFDFADHSLSLIADRGTGNAASERIVRPAHHRASKSCHTAPGDLGQRRVDLTEHIVLSEPTR